MAFHDAPTNIPDPEVVPNEMRQVPSGVFASTPNGIALHCGRLGSTWMNPQR